MSPSEINKVACAFPASFAQQRLWFLDRFEPENPIYNICYSVRLRGEIAPALFEQALHAIVQRHEALRTTFGAADGEPVQRIASCRDIDLPVEDLSHLAPSVRASELARRSREEARRPFDLACDTMLRARLFRLAASEHALVLTMHHIASDGWSFNVLFRELGVLYEALRRGTAPELPALPIQYADYAVWQRERLQGEVLREQLRYWKTQLDGIPPVLDLPLDRPRPPMQTYRGGTETFVYPEPVCRLLEELARGEGATLFMGILAAFQTLLHRYAGQRDVVLGSPIAGRNHVETENLIGFFTNTLVLRGAFEAGSSFRSVLRQAKATALSAFAHQELPFEKLVEELQPARDLSYHPLFQVLFVFQHTALEPLALSGIATETTAVPSGMSRFDITLFLAREKGGIDASVEYNADLFDRATISRLLRNFGVLLDGIVRNPDQHVAAIPLLDAAERKQLLIDWNATDAEPVSASSIQQLFESQVERTPDAVAVEHKSVTLTYRELNLRGNELAHYLQSHGIGPEMRVGICLDRSEWVVIALLAVLKAGGAYVPLDPSHPAERLGFVLRDAQCKAVITQESLLPLLTRSSTECGEGEGLVKSRECQDRPRLICLDREHSLIRNSGGKNLRLTTLAENLAYVLYTSGSTGRPKGVQISHEAFVNFLASMRRQPGMKSSDRMFAVTTISFDIAALELFLPIVTGACVVVASRETAGDGRRLAAELERSGATIMQATPATWRMLLDSGWRGDRRLTILCGGDSFPVELARELAPRCKALWNLYGPTETTIWSTCAEITNLMEQHGGNRGDAGNDARSAGAASVTIGRPIANTEIYILDECLEPVPIGVVGQLHIGGKGLARGYMNQPELTAEKFIPHPFLPARRLYRTGDLARYRADGQIEFLGRLDHQVKIRGFRIELGEIEAVLSRHVNVGQSVVVARKDATGQHQLAAYVVCRPAEKAVVSELREYLRSTLPDYMVPSLFVFLNAFPLTANGKIDRKALPAPEQNPDQTRALAAPCDLVEVQLLNLFQQLFGRQPIGTGDNFFDLGGHSLLAVRLFAEIEKVTGQNLPLATLFKAPTVRELAAVLRQQGCAASWSSLVALKPSGARPPLILVHAVGGNLLTYRDLIKNLDPDQPVYGLQSRGLDGKTCPLSRIEDMAEAYIAELKQLQPQGPYYLAGTSFGGVVAYEMARQLAAEGKQIGLVALFDSVHLNYESTRIGSPFSRCWERVKFHFGNVIFRRDRLAYIWSRIEIAHRRYRRKLRNRTWEVFHDYFERTGRPLPAALHRVNDANYYALKRFVPLPYSGNVTLFRSKELPVAARHDLEAAWCDLAQGGLEIHDVPGNHVTSMFEPHVKVLATELEKIAN